MKTGSQTEELLLAVIRGQLPVSALQEVEIHVDVGSDDVNGSERQINVNVTRPVTVVPKPIDIANGLLAYRNRPAELRAWAAFVLAASEIIDLAPLENWPEGDELLSGLWDASFDGSFKPETARLASALAES